MPTIAFIVAKISPLAFVYTLDLWLPSLNLIKVYLCRHLNPTGIPTTLNLLHHVVLQRLRCQCLNFDKVWTLSWSVKLAKHLWLVLSFEFPVDKGVVKWATRSSLMELMGTGFVWLFQNGAGCSTPEQSHFTSKKQSPYYTGFTIKPSFLKCK